VGVVTAPPKTKLITGKELLAMGDIGPCELLDGRIVPISLTGGQHAILESNLSRRLGNFVADRKLGWVLVGEVGVYTRHNPDRVRGADVAFISKERAAGRPSQGFLETAPELVVEILSPDDRRQDVQQKLEEYFSIDVRWVWIVEPENRTVLVYRSNAQVRKLSEADTLVGEGVLEEFSLPVADLFEE
jgi:Uma2 family endonuclease